MDTKRNKNPLEELLVDEMQSINLVELAQILKPFTVIDKTSQKIQFLQPFYEQKNELRILILLAATKAKKELFQIDEKISPSDIIALDLMPTGSVKAMLKKLSDEKTIKVENSKYYLPNYQLKALAAQLHIKNG